MQGTESNKMLNLERLEIYLNRKSLLYRTFLLPHAFWAIDEKSAQKRNEHKMV